MKTNRAMRYRIYPDEGQAVLIARTFGCARKTWNLMLADALASLARGEGARVPSPASYKAAFPYLREVDSYALTSEWAFLRKVLSRHFSDPSRTGMPRFKSRKRDRQSYTTCFCRGNVKVARGRVRLPKLGWVKASVHRRAPSGWRLKSATVSRNGAGRFFVSVLYELDVAEPEPRPVQSSIGLDYSSPSFYVGSDGSRAEHPTPYRRAQERLSLEQRRLSRMRRGSSNYRKQKARIGRLHQRIADIRRDFVEKESTRIANGYDLVAVEDLDLSAQARSLRFGKAVHDNGFGTFRSRLGQKLAERGGHLVVIGRWFPSSRLCRECGTVNAGLALGQSVWTCPGCGATHDRDAYAAETIRLEGLRLHREKEAAAATRAAQPQGLRG